MPLNPNVSITSTEVQSELTNQNASILSTMATKPSNKNVPIASTAMTKPSNQNTLIVSTASTRPASQNVLITSTAVQSEPLNKKTSIVLKKPSNQNASIASTAITKSFNQNAPIISSAATKQNALIVLPAASVPSNTGAPITSPAALMTLLSGPLADGEHVDNMVEVINEEDNDDVSISDANVERSQGKRAKRKMPAIPIVGGVKRKKTSAAGVTYADNEDELPNVSLPRVNRATAAVVAVATTLAAAAAETPAATPVTAVVDASEKAGTASEEDVEFDEDSISVSDEERPSRDKKSSSRFVVCSCH